MRSRTTTAFLCGDVMTGRGIDQILRHPSDPRLYEPYVRDARGYVSLAEEVNGPIPRPVSPEYVWGDVLGELERARPDVRIANLETSVTRSDEPWPGKGIRYRMHPDNVECLTAARLDVAVLANNHVLDWDRPGLSETLDTLASVQIRTAGAGRSATEAEAPAIVDGEPLGRWLVFARGTQSSGVPPDWAAMRDRSGVALLTDLSRKTARAMAAQAEDVKRPGDIVVASLHWGSNWGYRVPEEHVQFAHELIERGIDIVHGHSSHHPRPIEVYRNKLILYGCGDFLNDYEGISGYEVFRGDLALMYFVSVDVASGELRALRMVPMQIHEFRLRRAAEEDARWLARRLDEASVNFGTRVLPADGALELRW